MSMFRGLIDLFFPRRCAMCGGELREDEDVVCLKCNIALPRTFFWNNPYDNVLSKLLMGFVPIEKCSSLFFFTPRSESAQLVYELKYYGGSATARALGRMLANEMLESGFFDDIDAVTFVPLTAGRLRERGYNQSEMIARGVCDVIGKPLVRGAVIRTTFGGTQTRKSSRARNENVADAFKLVDESGIAGLHLLLVDDVVTTGATVRACGKELLRAEGVRVSVASVGYAGLNRYPVFPKSEETTEE